MDILGENKNIKDVEYITELHLKKTASLIVAAIEFAAILAGASLKEREILKSFGNTIGLAYQITDDILDVTSTEEVLGKPINSDKNKNKITAISSLGKGEAKALSLRLYNDSIKILSPLKYDTHELLLVAEKLVNRDS